MRQLGAAILALGVLCLVGLRAIDGPLTNLANIPIRTDANGYILAAAQTYSGPDGPRRVLANTLGRTDANGYLIITNPTGFLGTIPIPVSSGGTGTTTAFTQGSLVFTGASGVYTQNNAKLFWDNTLTTLGLGTANPIFPLTLEGQVTYGGIPDFIVGFSDTAKTAHGMTALAPATTYGVLRYAASTGGGFVFRGLSSSSSIAGVFIQGLIGSITPTVAPIALIGAKYNGGTSVTAVADTERLIEWRNNGTTTGWIQGNGDVHLNKADPSIIFDTLTAIDTDFWIGVQEDALSSDDDTFQIGKGTVPGTTALFTVVGSGNVGIGTTGPGAKLEVAGSISSNHAVFINPTVTGSGNIIGGIMDIEGRLNAAVNGIAHAVYLTSTVVKPASGTTVNITSLRLDPPTITGSGATVTEASALSIGGAPTGATSNYAMRVVGGTSRFDGNVGIGTDPLSGLLLPFSISSSHTTLTGIGLKNTDTGGHEWWIASTGSLSTPTAGKFVLYDSTAGSYRMVIDTNGNFGLGATTFPSTGTAGLVFADGTAPATMASNTAGLYADDVSGTVNIFAISEAGSIAPITTMLHGGTPTVGGACGTGPTIVGNNSAGKVTTGSVAPTSCTVTFATAHAFQQAPSCNVTNETTANLARATSTATTVILAGTMVAGDVLAYQCFGY